MLLDGTLDRPALLSALYELVENGLLVIRDNKGKVLKMKPTSPEIEASLITILDALAAYAMLEDQT
jgi:hypothetical protein